MHGTGLFIALSTLAGGGTVVLVDSMRLEPERIWTEVERNAVQVLTIVGDVFARPLLDALNAEPDPMGPLRAARHHQLGGHVEPRGEARPARPPPDGHAARLARRVRRA